MQAMTEQFAEVCDPCTGTNVSCIFLSLFNCIANADIPMPL